ncbi:MAG TPA: ATPase domain-containing protein [Solimonas sp.]|nr:ATPase domain-containing protein [Solimonas sp.]
MANANSAAPSRVATGIKGLDAILEGGLTPARLYLVEGDPGSGKTTLGLQFLLEGAKRGEKVIYVTLSETKDELWSVARSHGWSLDDISISELVPTVESLEPDEENTMFYPSEVELSATIHAVLKEIAATAPTRVVFDSLSEIQLLAQNPLRFRRQILALKQFFVGRDCTVLLLDDRSSGANDGQLQSIAHGVIALERESPDFGTMRRRVQILKLRGQHVCEGFHDYILAHGGLRVFPRLTTVAHEEHEDLEPVPSGIAELDLILGGGLDKGTSTLLIGPAGTGKSTLAAQYACNGARRGERTAMFLFDESPKTLRARCRGMGMDLDGALASGKLTIRRVDPGELSPGEFAHAVQAEVDQGASMIVIDSLNGYLNAMPDARFLTLQLHELLACLGRRGVNTLLLLAQQGLIGATMQTPVDTSYLADTVMVLRYFEAYGYVRQAMAVVKKRGGYHERTIREYKFQKEGIKIGPPLEEFHGVLSGTPTFHGADKTLLRGGRL